MMHGGFCSVEMHGVWWFWSVVDNERAALVELIMCRITCGVDLHHCAWECLFTMLLTAQVIPTTLILINS